MTPLQSWRGKRANAPQRGLSRRDSTKKLKAHFSTIITGLDSKRTHRMCAKLEPEAVSKVSQLERYSPSKKLNSRKIRL